MREPDGRRLRNLGAAAVLLLALAALLDQPPLRVDASWAGMIRADDPLSAAQARFREAFDAGEGVVAVLEGDAPAPRAAAAGILAQVRDWPAVGAVLGPAPGVTPPGTVSADGRAAAVYLWMHPGRDSSQEARVLVDDLLALPRPAGVRLRVAGSLVEELEIARTVEEDLLRIVPATFVALVLLGWFLMRSVGAGLALAATIGIVLLLTLATHAVLFGGLTTITILVVPIVMVVASANAVHFVSRWRLDRRALPAEAALRTTIRRGGAACLVAALTTGAGFLALLVIRIPEFTRLAILGASGCVWTVVVVVGLMPALLERLDRRALLPRRPAGPLAHLASLDLARRGRVAPLLALVLLVVSIGIGFLSSTTRTLDLVPTDSEVHRVAPLLDEQLGGSCYVEATWSWPDDLAAAAGFARLAEASARIESGVPDVRTVGSAAWILPYANALRPGTDPETVRRALQAGLPGSPPRMLSADGRLARLTVRTPSTTTRRLIEIADETESVLRGLSRPGEEIAVVGTPLLIGHAVEAVVGGQALACLLSVALVSLLAAVALRSWRVLPVLWAANVLPLAALAGVLGWIGEPISISTAVVGSVVFGLVVDDTLHFLFALREEGGDVAAAGRALARLAPAFVATSLLLLTGALVSSLGRTPAVAVFSRLMAVGVALALLCDLFVAPRVAARLGRRAGG